MVNDRQIGLEAVLEGVRQYIVDAEKITKANDRIAGSTTATSRTAGNIGASLTRTGGLFTAGLTVPILASGAAITKFGLDFEGEMTKIDALTDATAGTIQQLRGDILELSRVVAISPAELAGAAYFILSSGVRDASRATDVLTQSAKASAAGLGDVRQIADVVTSVFNAYRLSAGQAERVTSTLLETVKLGKGEPEELANSIGFVIPVAAQLGVSFEEVGAVLATLTNQGLNAENAVTALKNIFNQVLSPSDRSRKLFEELGFEIGAFREEIEKNAVKAMNRLTSTFRGNEEVVAALFPDIRGLIGVFSAFSNQGDQTAENLKLIEARLHSTDEAFKTAAQGPVFQFRQALNELQIDLTELGIVVIPIFVDALHQVQPAFRALAFGAKAFAELPREVQVATLAMAAFLAAIGPTLLAIGFMAQGITALNVLLAATFGVTLVGVLPWVAAFAAAIVAAGVASYLLYKNWDETSRGVQDASEAMGRSVEDAGDAFASFGARAEELATAPLEAMQSFERGLAETVDDVITSAEEAGYGITVGIIDGLEAGASNAYAAIAQFVAGMIMLLDPYRWVFGSTLPEVMEEFGEESGIAFGISLKQALRNVGGIVDEEIGEPIEQARSLLADISGELSRVLDLSSVESAFEGVQAARLRLRQFELEPVRTRRENEVRRRREAIDAIEDERDALERERDTTARGNVERVAAIQIRLRELAVAEKMNKAEPPKTQEEKELEIVEAQIDALDRLTERRELERAILEARGVAADRTLATDAEITSRAEALILAIGALSGQFSGQASLIQLAYVPALDSITGAMGRTKKEAESLLDKLGLSIDGFEEALKPIKDVNTSLQSRREILLRSAVLEDRYQERLQEEKEQLEELLATALLENPVRAKILQARIKEITKMQYNSAIRERLLRDELEGTITLEERWEQTKSNIQNALQELGESIGHFGPNLPNPNEWVAEKFDKVIEYFKGDAWTDLGELFAEPFVSAFEQQKKDFGTFVDETGDFAGNVGDVFKSTDWKGIGISFAVPFAVGAEAVVEIVENLPSGLASGIKSVLEAMYGFGTGIGKFFLEGIKSQAANIQQGIIDFFTNIPGLEQILDLADRLGIDLGPIGNTIGDLIGRGAEEAQDFIGGALSNITGHQYGGYVPSGEQRLALLHGPELVVPIGRSMDPSVAALLQSLAGQQTGPSGFRNYGNLTINPAVDSSGRALVRAIERSFRG